MLWTEIVPAENGAADAADVGTTGDTAEVTKTTVSQGAVCRCTSGTAPGWAGALLASNQPIGGGASQRAVHAASRSDVLTPPSSAHVAWLTSATVTVNGFAPRINGPAFASAWAILHARYVSRTATYQAGISP